MNIRTTILAISLLMVAPAIFAQDGYEYYLEKARQNIVAGDYQAAGKVYGIYKQLTNKEDLEIERQLSKLETQNQSQSQGQSQSQTVQQPAQDKSDRDEVREPLQETVAPMEFDWVDLGLSVKWARYNLGASSQEDRGDYYAWGEVDTKPRYAWSTYSYWVVSSGESLQTIKFIKYNNSSLRGVAADHKTQLDLSDDAARTKLGGTWRIPTQEEFKEMMSKCEREWTMINNVKGMKFTSTVSGHKDKWIFLPAAGFYDGVSLKEDQAVGNYWTSSLYGSFPYYAFNVFFLPGLAYPVFYYYRFFGLSVRPVCD